MYRVLIPVDRNVERSMNQSEYVTSLPGDSAEIEATVLFVFVDKSGDDVPFDTVDPGNWEPEDVDSVVAVRDHLEDHGVDVETRLEESDSPAHAIVSVADELDVNEIVMGGRQREGVSALLGSVSRDVQLSSGRPVSITA